MKHGFSQNNLWPICLEHELAQIVQELFMADLSEIYVPVCFGKKLAEITQKLFMADLCEIYVPVCSGEGSCSCNKQFFKASNLVLHL